MAELALVNVEALPPDTALRLIQTLSAVPESLVCSATVAPACFLLQRAELRCQLVLDANLNPRRTLADPSEKFATERDLEALRQRFQSYYFPSESPAPEEELLENAFKRIYYALLREPHCRKVALLANETLSRFGEWCQLSQVPMLLIIQPSTQINLKRALYTESEVRAFLAPIDMKQPQHLLLLKEIPALQANLQATEMATADGNSELDLGNLRGILTGLEEKVSKMIEELGTKAQDVNTVKKEFEAVWAISKDGLAHIRQAQAQVLKSVEDTKAAAMPIIEALAARLDLLEAKAAASALTKPVSRPLLTITGGWRGPDFRLVIGIEKRKAYFISGVLKVAKAGTVIYQTEVGIGQMQVYQPVGEAETFQEGQYSAWVEYSEGWLLSNSLVFDLPPTPTFADSLVSKVVDNLAEVETSLRDMFDEKRVALFRHLATTWTNENGDQINEFVTACLNQELTTEESLRAELQAKGMQFSLPS